MTGYPDWLDGDACKVFDATLPKVKNLTPNKAEMLAAYARAMVNLRAVRNDPAKAALWRKAMLYARNGLGIGGVVFVDLMDIICDWQWRGEPDPSDHLKAEWQLPESMRPGDYSEK